MKYAIDRYAIGMEKEVSADDFDGQAYIPDRLHRFYCPECGEIVFFRAKSRNNPNHFFHKEKTDRSPECDKRVDGRSSMSLTERVGLPIYLTTISPQSFQLNIGFPAIGAEMLNNASAANYVVEISSDDQCRRVMVNTINFIEDYVSLIPINFIPKNGRNYSITISGDKSIYGLRKKWSDYADGFDFGGAIFTYDEYSGKKIRRGDSITTHRYYYIVTDKEIPQFQCIEKKSVGKLNLLQKQYSVYTIRINTSTDEKSVFLTINDYLKNQFGIWLLEKSPELVPIWPPVIKQDYLIPVLKDADVICAVSSSNKSPNIYVYSDFGVSTKGIYDEYNGVKTVKVSTGKRPLVLSVDRKYVGREASFLSKEFSKSSHSYEVIIGDRIVAPKRDTVTEKGIFSDKIIITNTKMELYIGMKGHIFRHIPIRERSTEIPAINNVSDLFFVVESSIIRHLHFFNYGDRKNAEYSDYIRRMQSMKKVQMVPIPHWVNHIMRHLKNTHQDELFKITLKCIENGKIPFGVLTILRVIYKQNQHQ